MIVLARKTLLHSSESSEGEEEPLDLLEVDERVDKFEWAFK